MIKFGNLTNPLNNIISEIKKISKSFDFVEIGMEGPLGLREILDKKIKKIKSEIKKRKLFAIAHTAYYLDLGSPYELVRKAYVKEIKREIDLAKRLLCDKICVHLRIEGMYKKNDKAENIIIANYIKSLKELVKYAKKKGIKLMLENLSAKFSKTKKILDNVPGLYFHLDIGHAFIYDGMKGIERYIKTFRKKLVHIHVHDNRGKEDEHKEIGKGKINFRKVIKLLKEIKYDDTITLEVFGKNEKPALRSLKKLKKMLT